MASNETILWLAEVERSAFEAAGGKGANLGEMSRAGLPVPPAFVVTTAGYRHFVESNQLQAPIDALVAGLETALPADYEAIATQIRDLFLAGAMPEALAQAIGAALGELAARAAGDEDTPVAVRSSATAEDLPEASFAGQQATFLNVRGTAPLLDAIKACWASLWTARALAYRDRMNIDHNGVGMAVVVQLMAAATLSGVLFTANPTTGARDELVINASFGLGEAIVSGEVTPDSYVVDRASMKVKETRLGTKEVMAVAADGQGTTTQAVPEARRAESALTEPLLGELSRLGLWVEEQFDGVPQDIEWAVDSGRAWLLQARPITNLPPAPLKDVRWEPPRPGTVWMRRQVVEHMPEPLSPLFDELYLEEGLGQSIRDFSEVIGRLANMRFDMREWFEPPFATTVNGYAYSIATFDFSWRLVPVILRLYTVALPRMIRHMLPYWRDEGLPTYLATIEHWKQVDLESAADAELVQGVRALAAADAVYWFAAAVPLGLARTTDAALDGYLKSVARDKNASGGPQAASAPYLRGFPSKALLAQAELEAIARQIRSSDGLGELVAATPAAQLLDRLAHHPDGRPALAGIQAYLDRYGHQVYNLDFVAPTQAEDPLPVLLSLKSALAQPERDARAHQAAVVREREALVAGTERSLNVLQRPLFRLLLNLAQRYTPNREEALFYVGAAWPTLRWLALELGRRLTEAGSLDAPDHIFFLYTAELAQASAARAEGATRPDLARLARERQELREARKRLDPPISVPPNAQLKFGPFRLTKFEPQPVGASEGPILSGFAVSPGRATAAASVIRSPQEFDQMAPDTILVCTTTTPAWTPLFAQARGLVTDIGGALAHGSIVAREYGIPAVMGTGVATKRIRSGDSIRVDGDTGTVTLLAEAGAEASVPDEVPKGSPARKIVIAALVAGALVTFSVWRRRRKGR